jgi:HprK-related kinase A
MTSVRSLTHGVNIGIGPFTVLLRSAIAALEEEFARIYADYPIAESGSFADFQISIARPRGPRRWLRPQAILDFDGERPFAPSPLSQAFLLFEAGLNWLISERANQYLMVHAAGLEQGGRAVVMPAPPGSGKTTLSAGLASRGWRLLSDELALLEPEGGTIHPVVRPLSLKNDAVRLIQRYSQATVLSRQYTDTAKGAITFIKPPRESVLRAREPARPHWLVFPKYVAGAPAVLEPVPKARAFFMISDNSFNYAIHGRQGFEAVARLIEACTCYNFTYSSLDDAALTFRNLAAAA